VPWSDNRIDYKIDGPVKLLGFDNGDPLDVTTHRETYRNTFNGLSLGIFQSTDQSGPVVVTAAGILGRITFPETAKIAIGLDRLALRGKIDDATFGITYSINDAKPVKYTKPFKLTESATIKATITKNGKPFMNLQSKFTKAPLPKVTDPRLVTGKDEDEYFDGPRDKEVAGKWILKATQRGSKKTPATERTFLFTPTGSVLTLDGEKKNLYGYWWYNYPDKAPKEPTETGRGKLFMFVTDQMCTMKLETQNAKKMVIKSRFRTWFFERKE
jgi:hypothetical protein